MNIAEKMKRDWDQRAQHDARYWIATENYQTEEIFARSGQETAQALLKTLTGLRRASWNVLDIGCGIGRVLRPLAQHFHALVGIDVSSTMITQSKAWLAGYPNITTFENSGVDLCEFHDQSFNLVYSYVAFQHMPRQVFEQYLSEINRVLSPDGYLALQLPIGQYCDVALEDTIGIRSYSIQEIERKLLNHSLGFCHPDIQQTFRIINQPLDHRFHLIKKIKTIKPVINVKWVQLEQPEYASPLDMHLYETYAENCVKMGNPQEGIQTLESLVHRNPKQLSGWLRLAALLLENGQVQQAVTTIQQLTTLHPSYQEGHAILERLHNNYENFQNLTVPTNDHQMGQPDQSLNILESSESIAV